MTFTTISVTRPPSFQPESSGAERLRPCARGRFAATATRSGDRRGRSRFKSDVCTPHAPWETSGRTAAYPAAPCRSLTPVEHVHPRSAPGGPVPASTPAAGAIDAMSRGSTGTQAAPRADRFRLSAGRGRRAPAGHGWRALGLAGRAPGARTGLLVGAGHEPWWFSRCKIAAPPAGQDRGRSCAATVRRLRSARAARGAGGGRSSGAPIPASIRPASGPPP